MPPRRRSPLVTGWLVASVILLLSFSLTSAQVPTTCDHMVSASASCVYMPLVKRSEPRPTPALTPVANDLAALVLTRPEASISPVYGQYSFITREGILVNTQAALAEVDDAGALAGYLRQGRITSYVRVFEGLAGIEDPDGVTITSTVILYGDATGARQGRDTVVATRLQRSDYLPWNDVPTTIGQGRARVVEAFTTQREGGTNAHVELYMQRCQYLIALQLHARWIYLARWITTLGSTADAKLATVCPVP